MTIMLMPQSLLEQKIYISTHLFLKSRLLSLRIL